MKIKLGVFFGGESVEHEVSIISAIQAINFLDKEKYDVIPIYIARDNCFYVGEKIGIIEEYKDIQALLNKSQKVILVYEKEKVKLMKYPLKKFANNLYNYIDIAFPIVHGTNVEDGVLQGYLKTFKLPFVGCDVTASAVGMDKYIMKTILKDNQIPVLDCEVFNDKQYIEGLENILNKTQSKLEYPVIVKPINLGSSVGIKIAKNREELKEAVEYSFQFAKKILIEKAITHLREINCSVLGDYEEAVASECEEPISTDEILSYEDKYIAGDSGTKGMSSLKRKLPAELEEETKKQIQELAIKTFQVLGCNGVARIDLMIDTKENKIYVNEINTIPGSLSFYLWQATGLGYTELLDKMIDLALKRNREEQELNYSFETSILSNITLGGVKGNKQQTKI